MDRRDRLYWERIEGREDILQMNEYLLKQRRFDDLKKATEDEEFREKILQEIADN